MDIILDQIADFHCIAGECPITCCASWAITVDAETDCFYQSVGGEFGAALNASIDRSSDPALMKLVDGKCAMQDERGLCRIQLTLGEEHLCDTCKIYPRKVRQVGPYRFCYTTISCPEVAKELLSRKDELMILMEGDDSADGSEQAGLDESQVRLELAYEAFCIGIDILQNRDYDIGQRQILMLLMCHSLQQSLDEKDYRTAMDALGFFSDPSNYDVPPSKERKINPALQLRFLREVSKVFLSKEEWRGVGNLLLHCFKSTAELDTEAWGTAFSQYMRELSSGDQSIQQEQILVYAMFGHFMTSVTDWNLYHNAVFVVLFNQIFRLFVALSSMMNGSLLVFSEWISFISMFSRVFEHSTHAENAEEFLGLLEKENMLEPGNLFGLIN